jgi:DnaJ-class molecular chaperone
MSGARSHYDVLGVARDASPEEIHRAYRRLARQYHPDMNASADARARFAELSGAYEVLHDPERRTRYDRRIGVAARPAARGEAPAPSFTPRPVRRDVPRFLDDVAEPRWSGEPAAGMRGAFGWSVTLRVRVGWGPARRPWPDIRWLR